MHGRLADLSGNRREDLRLLQVILRDDEIRLRLGDGRLRTLFGGLGLLGSRLRVVALLLGDAALVRLLHALPIALRTPRFGRRRLQIGLRRLQVGALLVGDRLIAFVVKDIEELSLLHEIAFLELDLLDVTVDLRQKIDLLHRLGVCDVALGQVVGTHLDLTDRHGLRHPRHHRGHARTALRGPLRQNSAGDPAAGHTHRRQHDARNHRTDCRLAFSIFICHCVYLVL